MRKPERDGLESSRDEADSSLGGALWSGAKSPEWRSGFEPVVQGPKRQGSSLAVMHPLWARFHIWKMRTDVGLSDFDPYVQMCAFPSPSHTTEPQSRQSRQKGVPSGGFPLGELAGGVLPAGR